MTAQRFCVKQSRGSERIERMSARALAVIGASFASIALAACGDNANGAKTEQSSAERVAAALDICAEADTVFAQRVCSNRPLAAIDSQIREMLVAESAEISDAGAQLLIDNQAQWREATRIACGLLQANAEPTEQQQACLEGQFRSRLQQARDAVQELGGYTFQRIERVEAAPLSAAALTAAGLTAEEPRAAVRDIRYPRIDRPQTPQVQRFNQLMVQEPSASLGEGDSEIVDYEIVYAGPELISVRFDSSRMNAGGAHPNNSVKAVTVLMEEGRPIAAGDVFRADSGWADFLTERAVAEIARQFTDYDFTPPERDVRESVTEPHLWLVTERGLVILFPPYSFGGPHALGGTEVTIPWAELRPYLNPAAPAPIGASA